MNSDSCAAINPVSLPSIIEAYWRRWYSDRCTRRQSQATPLRMFSVGADAVFSMYVPVAGSFARPTLWILNLTHPSPENGHHCGGTV